MMMIAPRISLLAMTLYAATTGWAVAGTAPNRVVNSGFNTDLGAWSLFVAFDVTERWTAQDAHGLVNSGSIQGTLPAAGTFRTPIYASQCVTLQPGTVYAVGASILLPAATTPPGAFSTVFVNTYANAGCFGNNLRHIVAPNVTAVDAWTTTQTGITSGSTELSAQINLRVFAPGATRLTSHFDDVYLREDGIFADDLDG